MTTKEITIQGKTYPVIFTMKTIINFEAITDKTFFGDKLDKLTDRIALIIAAVLAANNKAKLEFEDLTDLDWDGIQELHRAFAVIMDMSYDFFKIPRIMEKAQKEEGDEKNV